MKPLPQDLVYAVRQLRRRPGFTFAAILTLALGIGATTAVFSFVYAILLKPLPYANPGQLVTIWERVKYLGADHPYVEVNFRHAQYWKQRATDISDLTLLRQGTAGVSEAGASTETHPQMVGVVMAYPNLFSVLGEQPQLGRTFTAEEGTLGHDHVAILSFDLWQRLFHGDPGVLGQSVLLNGTKLQIVGLLPRTFHFPKGNTLKSSQTERGSWPEIGVFVPLIINQPQESLDGDYNFVALARLKQGVTLEQATDQLNTIDQAILRDLSAATHSWVGPDTLKAFVQPLQETVAGSVSTLLWLLLAAVLSVLLIACVNLASLQLARARMREKEFSLRVALGATTLRLLSAAAWEGLLLALLGGAAGLLLAAAATRFFVAHAPVDLPRLDEVTLNPAVLGFAAAITALTAVTFGLVPALKALRSNPQTSLQQTSARTSLSPLARRAQFLLIAAQVATATALLIVMGLLSRSLLHLLDQHRGFATGSVVSLEVDVDGKRFEDDPTRAAFDDELLRRLRTLPGITSAGLVSAMPLTGETWLDGISRPDRPEHGATITNYRWISPGYLPTLGIPLLRGRQFTDGDRTAKVALISEHTAREIWPGQAPLTHQFRRGDETYTVIGLVADTRSNSLKQAPGLMVYLPFWDNPPYATFFMVRTPLPAADIGETLRRTVWSLDPGANIAHIGTLDQQVNESLAPERSQTFVLSSFGIAALLLAALGIYGVLSYSVSARRQELGVRLALGASRGNLYQLTLLEAARPVVLGLGCGVLASALAGFWIRSLLFNVQPLDPAIIAAVVLIFLAVGVIAALVPCRRAASIDPARTLHTA